MTESDASEPQPVPGKKPYRWLWRLVKIAIFMALFLAVIFTVMMNMAGNSDTLKGSIEDYLSEATGHPAKIRTLNHMSFFPDIGIDVEGVEILEDKTSEKPIATAENIVLRMRFWDVTLSTGRMKRVVLKNLRVDPGVLLQDGVFVEVMEINDRIGVQRPSLELLGTIGETRVEAHMAMEAKGEGKQRIYSFGKERDFGFMTGDVAVNGVFEDTPEGIRMSALEAGVGGMEVMKGFLTLTHNDRGKAVLGGEMSVGKNSVLKPDITILQGRPFQVSGAVNASRVDAQDFLPGSPLRRLIDIVDKTFNPRDGATPESIPPVVDIKLSAESFTSAEGDAAPLDAVFVHDADGVEAGEISVPEGSSLTAGEAKKLLTDMTDFLP